MESDVTKIDRPASSSTFYIGRKTRIIGEYDRTWITLGFLGSDEKILLDIDEWPGFVALVNAINEDVTN